MSKLSTNSHLYYFNGHKAELATSLLSFRERFSSFLPNVRLDPAKNIKKTQRGLKGDIGKRVKLVSKLINPFYTTGLFLYPVETSKPVRGFDLCLEELS